jgi:trans-AT polyketide synthase/acyltransferase/oxidoreductase domain-containing protein
MADAERDFRAFLEPFELAAPRIPVVSNVSARVYERTEIKTLLAGQITRPVRWVETVQWLSERPDAEFTELGPGNVLTGLLRRIKMEGNATAGSRPGQL